MPPTAIQKNAAGTGPPGPLDFAAAAIVTLFAMAIVVVPPPNLDLWWLMATGRRIVETHAYIYQDPFTFTVPGAPWSPQSWASALIYYGLFKTGGMVAIGVLRVALTGAVAWLVFRAIRAAGGSWAVASPLVIVAVITAHTRFADRGQLFEYVCVAWLLGFLLTAHERRGRSFYVLPVAVQLAWVQFHSSFLLGPVLAAAWFAGEGLSSRTPFGRALHRHDFRRAAILVALMAAACAVNPNPKAFLIQPFDSAQRELISHFTLEWKSPFDPAIAAGNFHPFYEILLALAALAVLLSLPRLPLGPLSMIAATAYLSLESHRFRVEFALVTAVMAVAMLRHSTTVARLAKRHPRRGWAVAGLVLTLSLVALEHERFQRRPRHDLEPDRALAFVAEHGVAQRAFHPIGFGSYMLWRLYGERPTFIDGRNFDAGLYGDFLRAQTGAPALRDVVRKYRVDAFILPAPARADTGMRNVHQALAAWGDAWDLVYMDEQAFVYVERATADSTWLSAHAYRAYRPLTFTGDARGTEIDQRVIAELERATTGSPGFAEAWMDLGRARLAGGDAEGASAALRRAVEIDRANAEAWNSLGDAEGAAGRFDRAAGAFTEVTRLAPGDPAGYVNLARARAASGDVPGAVAACERALAIDPNHPVARELMQALRGAR